MTDEQLHDELERRSKHAHLSHDWSRRELLPAVSAAIDTRPQRVATSRVPALAGLAGVAAIILVLVVAIPGITPSPPVANPSSGTSAPDGFVPGPAPLEIMSAQEFAVGVLTGRLRSSTVLVDGTIGDRPALDGPACHVPAGQMCLMGRLEGTDPSVDVQSRWRAVKEEDTVLIGGTGEGEWPWLHLPSGPVSGTLLLTVKSDGVIEFIGLVDPGTETRPLAVADAIEVDIESLDLDDIVLVEGWLWSGEGPDRWGSILCRAPEFSPPPGLPNDYCQEGGRDAVVDYQRNTGNSATAPEPRLLVQRDAAQEFGGSVGKDPHVFAVAPRLYGGRCEGAPPCWKWEVVGRLSGIEQTPEPSPPPVREIGCALPPGLGVPYSAGLTVAPSIVDHIGIVASCRVMETTPLEPFPDPISIQNPDGDERVIEVAWSGAPCDVAVQFALSRDSDGVHLDGTRPDIRYIGCDDSLVVHHLRVFLTEPLAAQSIAPTISDPAPPSPTTVPPLTEPQHIDCDGAPADFSNGAVRFEDHTGLVQSCAASAAEYRDDGVTGSNPDPTTITLTWAVPCAADTWRTQLQLWPRQPVAPNGSSSPGYLLVVNRLSPLGDGGCLDAMSARQVEINLATPIDWADIDVLLQQDGRARAMHTTDAGDFRLSLTSDAFEYGADEPIAIEAGLLYDGAGPAELSGAGLINGFGIEQLDGPLHVSPLWTQPCMPLDLRAAEPLFVPFFKSGALDPDDPGAFSRDWFDDPILRLPAGTWLITVHSNFMIGRECLGERVELEASIVIRVR